MGPYPCGSLGPCLAISHISSTKVNAAGGSADALTLSGTLGAMDGSDTFRGIYLNYTNADHTGASNEVIGMEIAGITGDAQAKETAMKVGDGWDVGLDLGNNSIKTGATILDSTKLSYLDGVTSNIQTQLDGKSSNALVDGHIFIGSALGVATDKALSGDATINNAGSLTIANDAITAVKIKNGEVSASKLGTDIGNANIDAAAGIAYSKLNLSNGIVAGDLADGAVTSAKIGTDIANTNIANNAGIAYSKLNLTGSIVNADVSGGAAIDFSKLAGSSASLAGALTDETGSGAAVFGTSPTFTTGITDPVVTGGTGAASTLTLQSTSGAGGAGADIIFKTGNNGATEDMRILNSGNVGIGDSNPASLFTVGSGKFQVDGNGNIIALNNVTTSFPSSNSAGVLSNNGSGTLSWGSVAGGLGVGDITSSLILNGTILDEDINAGAAITSTKVSLADGKVLVGNVSNQAAAVSMSGDATILNDGTLTIANDAITAVKIKNGEVSAAKIGTDIGNANIDTNAAIAGTKISPSFGTQAISSTKVNAAGGSTNALTLSGTLGAMDGSDTFRGIYLNYTNADHTGVSNEVIGIEIAGITGDADATESAIKIGSGWDNAINLNGTGISSAELARLAGKDAPLIDTNDSPTLTGAWNFAGATLLLPNGTSLPGTCTVGEHFMKNNAASGQMLYLCEATNSWVVQGGGGGSGDITAVGSMASGDAFADASADGQWLGLGSGAGRIAFDANGLGTDRVNILDADVGVGTTAPAYPLDVVGSGITINAKTSAGTSGAYIGFDHTSEGSGRSYVLGSTGSGDDSGVGNFQLYDATASATRLTVNSSGYVGIGDSSPAALLTVGSGDKFQVDGNGDIVKLNNVTTAFPSSNSAGVLSNNGSGTLTWSSKTSIAANAYESVTPSLSSSSGWTSTNGLGAASVNTGVATIDLSSTNVDINAAGNRPHVTRAYSTDFTAQPINPTAAEVVARLASYSGTTTTGAALVIYTTWMSDSIGIYAGYVASGNLSLQFWNGCCQIGSTVTTVLPADGTGYLRLRVFANTVEAFYGTGTSSTYPSTWTLVAIAASTVWFTPVTAVNYGVGIVSVGGTPTVNASFDRIYVRSLLPPAPQ
ncbi:MAG: hypothetical protein HQM15_08455 [Deltaproteobacteria bacterium]|nr:hypothetical protein [Deltaproteobacteria bacterium]